MRTAHRPARVLGALVAVIITVVCTIGVGATPAQAASSSTLCKGFKDCAREGRSSAGYAAVFRQSFWNMRAGHNCTNYVGHRLTQGRLTDRPPGANDAGTWGQAARAAGIPVTRTPRVGSVAWWKPGYHGAGSSGHVAYVEAVRKDGSILISEDNLGGAFMWRRLSRSSSAWPSGFIQFPRSDGSPSGTMLWAAAEGPGRVRLSGTAGEWDVPAGPRGYEVWVGAPRGTAGAESFTFSSSFFRFERIKTLSTRGATTLYVYALNTPGTAGADTLLGTRAVTIG
jgi:surface antigen